MDPSCHATPIIFAHLKIRELAEFLGCSWATKISRCIGWGPKPTWNGSHIHFKHILGVLAPSYAVDGEMDPPCHATPIIFAHLDIRELANFLGCSWATNDVKVHWLRPQIHLEWFPYPLQKCIWCFSTFICCWCEAGIHHHGTVIIFAHLEIREELAKFVGSYKWCQVALDEPPEPHGMMVLNSSSNIYMEFDNIHMLWMGRWIRHHATSIIIVCFKFGELAKFVCRSWATNDVALHWFRPQTHMEWFPHPLQTYKRCLAIFMFCGCADGSTIVALPSYLFISNLGSWLNSWVAAGYKWCLEALV